MDWTGQINSYKISIILVQSIYYTECYIYGSGPWSVPHNALISLNQHDCEHVQSLVHCRAEVNMLIISSIILFRIPCNFIALCSKFHALFSQDHCQNNPELLFIAVHDYSIRVI